MNHATIGGRSASATILKYVRPPVAGILHVSSAPDASAHGALKERRSVLLDIQRGFVDTPIYDYQYLAHGHVLQGPAVVEAPTTTVVIPHQATGTVDQLGNIVIRYS